tara:strand:+ start:5113 stop:7167 length:2055 start_codon:yes stop_codon:yes gene_type:complete
MSRVFPENAQLVEENSKQYIIFPKGGTGVMLADKLYHTTGDKAGQRIKLTDKMLKQFSCTQPGEGWYASEKFDGLRGIWTGQELVARPSKDKDGNMKGKVFTEVPQWFKNTLPTGVSLDGEIWMGRGKFQQVAGLSNLKISKKQTADDISKLWRGVKFMIFDCPSDSGPFRERMQRLTSLVDNLRSNWQSNKDNKGHNFPVEIVNNYLVKNDEFLMKLYRKLTESGAEGLMLRGPNNIYETKRSKMLLKMKVQDDAEAIVLEYMPGTGKYDRASSNPMYFMLGALKCRMDNGVEFNIGTGLTDEMRLNYWDPEYSHYIPIGATVNFSYMELTEEGIPRHPAYRGVRTDVCMEEGWRPEDGNYLEMINNSLRDISDSVRSSREANYTFKVAKYNKAIEAFKKAGRISSVADALEALRNSGEKLEKENPEKPTSSILKKVEEIIKTGKCREATKAQDNPKNKAVKELTKIQHIGEAKAVKLHTEFSIQTPEDLLKNKTALATLTDAQKLGLQFLTDLSTRIPRSEMDEWNVALREIGGGIMTGSYRRNKSESGDVDFLLCGEDDVISVFMKKLEKSKKVEVLGSFCTGEAQWQGVARLRKRNSLARHVDIFCYPIETIGYAVLHATGSGNFNISCRKMAIDKGYRLSQYGMTPKPKELELRGPPEEDERKILEFIGVGYVKPEDRH